LLIAGVGTQAGRLGAAVRAGVVDRAGVIVSSSRSITNASTGPDFAAAARTATLRLHQDILAAL
jgi:orotidine-5'-phosphate decarboxylase